jgi:hypothetical protein
MPLSGEYIEVSRCRKIQIENFVESSEDTILTRTYFSESEDMKLFEAKTKRMVVTSLWPYHIQCAVGQ